jgi:transposase
MHRTEDKYDMVKHLLPLQRGNVEIDNFTFLQAVQYISENGCKWRALPSHFGKWNTVYRRFRRWIDKGVFDKIEKELRSQAVKTKGVTKLALDSTYIKVHPDGTGAPKKRGNSR